MCEPRKRSRRNAFTLIELMVVVAIIGLLVAVLLPTFTTVRRKAKYTQAAAYFNALDQGLEVFRGEQNLGGSFPPSGSDNPDSRQLIVNPQDKGGTQEVRIAGAHLLAQAMVGADGLGTPGFKDTGSGNDGRDGYWWNDTHRGTDGVYELETTGPKIGQEKHVRYGGAGYVDEKMRTRMTSLGALADKGLILNLESAGNIAVDEPLFVDPWDMPILYYRANAASVMMIGSEEAPGIFWQQDNGIITGSNAAESTSQGLDFGAGAVNNAYHEINLSLSPLPATLVNDISTLPLYDQTLARFILDPTITSRATPVKKDSYLLISAGPDARYGTADDVTNWTRSTE